MTDQPIKPPPEETIDIGFRCPKCAYNLTGLVVARCPECGEEFDWEAVRAAAARPTPVIAFEKARGWRKAPAFVRTWFTALFVPWVFAREAVQCISLRHAGVFFLLCYVPVTLRYMDSGFDESYPAWLTAAVVCILCEMCILSVWDPNVWRRPKQTFAFWLAVGGYTSAIAVTEVLHAPPLFVMEQIIDAAREVMQGDESVAELLNLAECDEPFIGWMQVVLWQLGLMCCYVVRLRRVQTSRSQIAFLTIVVWILLFALYTFCTQYVGPWTYSLFGGSF